MFRRATFIPPRIIFSSISGDSVLGPIVQVIFVFLIVLLRHYPKRIPHKRKDRASPFRSIPRTRTSHSNSTRRACPDFEIGASALLAVMASSVAALAKRGSGSCLLLRRFCEAQNPPVVA